MKKEGRNIGTHFRCFNYDCVIERMYLMTERKCHGFSVISGLE